MVLENYTFTQTSIPSNILSGNYLNLNSSPIGLTIYDNQLGIERPLKENELPLNSDNDIVISKGDNNLEQVKISIQGTQLPKNYPLVNFAVISKFKVKTLPNEYYTLMSDQYVTNFYGWKVLLSKTGIDLRVNDFYNFDINKFNWSKDKYKNIIIPHNIEVGDDVYVILRRYFTEGFIDQCKYVLDVRINGSIYTNTTLYPNFNSGTDNNVKFYDFDNRFPTDIFLSGCLLVEFSELTNSDVYNLLFDTTELDTLFGDIVNPPSDQSPNVHITDMNNPHNTTAAQVGAPTTQEFEDHTTDNTIHFTEDSIDHLNIQNNGTYTHNDLDNHVDDITIHFTEASIDHENIQNIGVYDHDTIDGHIDNTNNPHIVTATQIGADNIIDEINTNGSDDIDWVRIDKTGSNLTDLVTRSHTNLTDIGIYTHDDIDNHIDDNTIHFTEDSIDHLNIQNIGNYTHDTIDQIFNITKEPTGFPNRTDTTIGFVNGTRTFTITGSNFPIYYKGIKYLKNTESIVIPDVTGIYYIYYDDNIDLVYSLIFPGWGYVLVGFLHWNSTISEGLLGDERHGLVMDHMTHDYLHHSVGTRFHSGLSGTFTNTTFTIESGAYYDEDIEFVIGPQTQCRLMYKNGSPDFIWSAPTTLYYYTSGGNIYYNNGNSLAGLGQNQYVAYWIFATNNLDYPIVSIMGQRVDSTLANAKENNTYQSLSLGELPFEEYKLLYRVILKNDTTPYEETQDLRNITNLPSGTYVATDHTVLTNLNSITHHHLTQEEYANITFNTTWVTIPYSSLSSGGSVKLLDGISGVTFTIIDILNYFDSDFSGGDRDLIITDGTNIQSTITSTNLSSGNNINRWGDIRLPFPSNQNGMFGEAGSDIIVQYNGGTTDYIDGEIRFKIMYAYN